MLTPASAPAPAGFAPRRAVPHPNPGAPQLPVLLRLGSTPPEGVAYAVASYWEERFGDHTRRDQVLTHTLTLRAVPADAGCWVVTLDSTAPVSSKPDLSALEQVQHLLSGLFRRLVLHLTPDGRLVAVLNHAEVQHTWQGIRQQLLDRSGGGSDEATQTIVAGFDAKLQQPGPLLESLRYHYLYDALFANYCGHFESNVRYEQPRRYAVFFADAPLCLTERLSVAAPPAPGYVALRCDGSLDDTRTDRAALARCIDAAWAASGRSPADRPPTNPAAVRAAYDAATTFDAATGWPLAVELSVRCRAGHDYHKEYFLRLTPTP